MNIVTLLQPSRIVFGSGCASQAVEFLAQRDARRVLLVTTKSVGPRAAFLVEALQRHKIEVRFAPSVPPEPTLEFFNRALAEAKAAQIDSVLGVGGGSALDVAKLLAALVHGARPLACSDMFFSPMSNLLLPGRSAYMGGGWETRRSRPPGEDWPAFQRGMSRKMRPPSAIVQSVTSAPESRNPGFSNPG